MPVDVRAIGCDWLTGTARKFLRGPRGVGFLYASRRAHARCARCLSVRGASCGWAHCYFQDSLCALAHAHNLPECKPWASSAGVCNRMRSPRPLAQCEHLKLM